MLTNFPCIISIVVPTYNRPERLRDCLKYISQSDFPCDRFQVIVVDDGSSQPASDVISPFESELNIRCLRQDNKGPAAARNFGVSESSSRFIAFIDDDCQVSPRWLSAVVRNLEATPDVFFGGSTSNSYPSNIFCLTSQTILNIVYTFYNSDVEDPKFFASNNIALARDRFVEMNGFDTTFPLAAAEDRDFCDRWRFRGWTMRLLPDALVSHAHSMSLRGFWRQQYNYGRGAFQYHRLRRRRRSGRIWQDLRMHANLPTLICQQLGELSWLTRIKVFHLLLLWQIANLCGFIRESLYSRRTARQSTGRR
ncbi:MAG: glycosyltransferase [Planctomycetes bacterium]|nr:glycosyltransferase [Planctomycetota bacterium]